MTETDSETAGTRGHRRRASKWPHAVCHTDDTERVSEKLTGNAFVFHQNVRSRGTMSTCRDRSIVKVFCGPVSGLTALGGGSGKTDRSGLMRTTFSVTSDEVCSLSKSRGPTLT